MARIPLTRPVVDARAKQAVLAVLESGHLTEGPVTAALEARLAAYTGAARAVAVTSCTTGLELTLQALGIGPGDEVIVPDYTYPATATAVARVGARPVVVDVHPKTMLMDPVQAEAAITPSTRALLPVSLFGNPLDPDPWLALARRHGLALVEDAACALGAEMRGQRTGSLADATVFSFHPRKSVTTGEGGMVTTNNADLADRLQSLKRFGLDKLVDRQDIVFARMGTNAKLSDILAALGLAQMERADEFLARRRELAAGYDALLAGQPGITFPEVLAGGRQTYQTYCVFVANRDRILASLHRQGIEVQIGTYSLHRQPAFQDASRCRLVGDMAGSQWAFDHCLALPLFHDMTRGDQETVAAALVAEVCP